MRHKWLAIIALAAPILNAGCMRHAASTSVSSDFSSIPVRFVMTPEFEWNTTPEGAKGDVDVTVVADNSAPGFEEGMFVGSDAMMNETFHVALWGGSFEGNNVTHGVTMLTPGAYTFAMIDRQHGASLQGWVDVHGGGSDILDALYRWKNNVPRHKERIAFEWDLLDGSNAGNTGNFFGFSTQLDALNTLDQRIDGVIESELAAQAERQRNVNGFLRNAEILLVPGTEKFFHPTTDPTFNEDDLTSVRNGQAMSKIVLVADYDEARWKLGRVNELYGDLLRCKEVFHEEVDRLERRKGLFLLTDHLHQHDIRFVQNEIQLQQALDSLSALETDMGELRDRRTALAFITGLFSSDGTFKALDQERGNLKREFAVLEAEQRRINMVLDEVDESSVRRVALERRRQRNLAGIESVNRQLEELGEARDALVVMSESTNVLHRQGDTRLLTSTFVASDMPFTVRQAVENEAVMTVRMEANEDIFVPVAPSVTSTQHQPATTFASQTFVPAKNADTTTETTVETTSAPGQGVEFRFNNEPRFEPEPVNNPSQIRKENDNPSSNQKSDKWDFTDKWSKTQPTSNTPSGTDYKTTTEPVDKQTGSTGSTQPGNIGDGSVKADSGFTFDKSPATSGQLDRPEVTTNDFDNRTGTVPNGPSVTDGYKKVNTPTTNDEATVGKTNAGYDAGKSNANTKSEQFGTGSKPFPTAEPNNEFKKPVDGKNDSPTKNDKKDQATWDFPCADDDQPSLVENQPNDWSNINTTDSAMLAANYGSSYEPEAYESAKVVPQENNEKWCPPILSLLLPPCWFPNHDGDNSDSASKTASSPESGERWCPPVLSLLIPPCWFQSNDTNSDGYVTRTASVDESNDRWCPPVLSLLIPPCWFNSHTDSGYEAKKVSAAAPTNKSCPPFLSLFIPPCWFNSDWNNGTESNSSNVQLAVMQDPATGRVDNRIATDDSSCECPLLLRLLVPPCWIGK